MIFVGLLILAYVAVCLYRGNLIWELGVSRRSNSPYFYWFGIGTYSVVALMMIYAGYINL
ncbi:MAG: hypothetical protein R3C41_01390 [Calditrichia bacterium]